MKVFGSVVVSAFAVGIGLLLAVATYRVLYGSLPECADADFTGLVGSLRCGGGNPSFTPYALGGIAVAAVLALRWWRRFVRALDT